MSRRADPAVPDLQQVIARANLLHCVDTYRVRKMPGEMNEPVPSPVTKVRHRCATLRSRRLAWRQSAIGSHLPNAAVRSPVAARLVPGERLGSGWECAGGDRPSGTKASSGRVFGSISVASTRHLRNRQGGCCLAPYLEISASRAARIEDCDDRRVARVGQDNAVAAMDGAMGANGRGP